MTAKIKNLSVDWMERWANDPRFIVELDGPIPAWPAVDMPVWVNRGGIHFADMPSIMAYYFYTDGKPTEGYGGRIFQGTFVNGDGFTYRGAWSSRASCVNDQPDLPNIVDVVIGNTATAVLAREVIAFYKENRDSLPFGLAWVISDNEGKILQPTRNGTTKNKVGHTLIHI